MSEDPLEPARGAGLLPPVQVQERWSDQKKIRWNVIASICAVLTVVWGVFIYFVPPGGGVTTTAGSSGSTTVPSPTLAAATPPLPETEPPTPQGIGTCLGVSGPVACDLEHRREVISTTPATCGPSELASYLGGTAGGDPLRSSISVSASDGRCVVTFPASVQQSMRGALQRAEGAFLRLCYDNRSGTPLEVGCHDPHTHEVVRVDDPGAGSAPGCDAAAATFIDATHDSWGMDLMAAPTTIDGRRACLVRPRGDRVLTSTLRRVGTHTLPLASL